MLSFVKHDVTTGEQTRKSVFVTEDGFQQSVFQALWPDDVERSVFSAHGNWDTSSGIKIPLAECLASPGLDHPTLYLLSKAYLPYLVNLLYPNPIPLPLREQAVATEVVRSVGTSSYTPVEVGSSIGYYGIADTTAAGLFYLNTDGVPVIAEPYLLNINNTLDVPLSSLSTTASQTLEVLQNIKTNTDATRADVSDIKTINTSIVSSLATTNDLLTQLLGKVDTTNELLSELNIGSGGSGIVESINNLASVITSLLTFRPPRQVRLDTGVFEDELTLYKPMTLAEITARGLFCSNPVKLDIPAGTLDYTFAPYLSAGAPFQGAFQSTTGRVYSQFMQPDYPVATAAVYEDELSGNGSIYANVRYDPYHQYHSGAHVTPEQSIPNTLVYAVTKTVSQGTAALTVSSRGET